MIMNELKIRLNIKRKKPKFIRKRGAIYKRLGLKWRASKGIHSKMRKHKKEAGHQPRPGYGSPRSVEGLHPSGFAEVMIYNVKGLDGINPQKQACRVSATVGKKKKQEIMKRANELKIKVLNPLKIQ
jgi:large subunit ribosomal protein L32e